jgi:hypothetical protein
MPAANSTPTSDGPPPIRPPSRAPIEGGPQAPPGGSPLPLRPGVPPGVREEEPKAWAGPGFDWLTEVFIPLAVFGLLGSFFYYLIDIRGAAGDPGTGALRWVCFWFLLGTILTTRMRSRYGAHIIALPYVIGLALAIALFVPHLTMYSGTLATTAGWGSQLLSLLFNYALVGLIWWVASLLTRATTAEENFMGLEDEGLISSMRRKPRPKPKLRRGQTEARPPRHPGWALMWMSLAALITFALGQQVTAGASAAYRAHAFLCMVSYSFFALVLLALTSLSAMRMSARRRKIKVAPGITPVWAIASTIIVILILAVAAILPRVPERVAERIAHVPHGFREPPETPLQNAPAYGARKPRANPAGRQRSNEETGSRPGAAGPGQSEHPEQGKTGSPTAVGGLQGEKPGAPQAGGAGEKGKAKAPAEGRAGDQGQAQQGKTGQGEQDQTGPQQQGGQQAGAEKQMPSESGGRVNEAQGPRQQETSAAAAGTGQKPSRPSGVGQRRSASGGIDLLKQFLLWLLMLLALLLLLALIAYLIYRAWKERKQLPSFRGWLSYLWALAVESVRETLARVSAALARAWERLLALFGWRPRLRLGADGLPKDPFADIFAERGLAESLTPAQVVRHVYAGFQAFMELIGYRRPDNETPYEFARTLPSFIGGLPREDADCITSLYVKAAYSPEEMGAGEVTEVRELWQRMQEPIDRALAARRKPGRPALAPSPA